MIYSTSYCHVGPNTQCMVQTALAVASMISLQRASFFARSEPLTCAWSKQTSDDRRAFSQSHHGYYAGFGPLHALALSCEPLPALALTRCKKNAAPTESNRLEWPPSVPRELNSLPKSEWVERSLLTNPAPTLPRC